jgi:hypothetical protein
VINLSYNHFVIGARLPWVIMFIGMLAAKPSLAQNGSDNFLLIRGWVIHNERPVPRAVITVYEGDSVVYSLRANARGRFNLYMPFQKEFVFSFSKEGYVTKKIVVNTVTQHDPEPEYAYYMEVEIELFEDDPCLQTELFRFPVAIVYYDCKKADFNFYLNSINAFVAKHRPMFRDSTGVVLEGPVDFYKYLQAATDERDGVHILSDRLIAQVPVAAVREDEEDKLLIVDTEESVKERSERVQDREPEQQAEVFPQSVVPSTQRDPIESDTMAQKTDEREITSEIDFRYFFRPGQAVSTIGKHFFSVQLLATPKDVPAGYFDRIAREMPGTDVLHYIDHDHLNKYIIGQFATMDDVINHLWQLKTLGYDTYIVAFTNNRRARVADVQNALRE